MKKFFIAAAALLIGISASAQQALWGGASVESPVVNEDGTVTFRYRAPKAVKVTVSGDFLPTQKVETPFRYEWVEGWSQLLGSMIADLGIVMALFMAITLSPLFAEEWHSNTLQSLEKGRPTEIDIMNGYISSKGREYGVPTPVNDSLTAIIKEIEAGRRPLTKKNLRDVQEK